MGHNVAGNDRTDSLSSRGTTIITQKENKGEYNGMHCWGTSASECSGGWLGGNWYWQESDSRDIYAHVFDQNDSNGTPYQYSTYIPDWSNNQYWNYPNNIPYCTTMSLGENRNNHKDLYSRTLIPATDKACVANTHNAGNWYNFPAATAGSDNSSTISAKDMSNSICPKGWQLPPNADNKSYNNLIHAYGIYDNATDSNFLNNLAMSFVRLGYYGYYHGSVYGRGQYGFYWSSIASNDNSGGFLHFYSGYLDPRNSAYRPYGMSIRCVSR